MSIPIALSEQLPQLKQAAVAAQNGTLSVDEALKQKVLTPDEAKFIKTTLPNAIEEGSKNLYKVLSEIVTSYDVRGNLSELLKQKVENTQKIFEMVFTSSEISYYNCHV